MSNERGQKSVYSVEGLARGLPFKDRKLIERIASKGTQKAISSFVPLGYLHGRMRIQTMSIVAGTEACNARCPYCVASMTPAHDLGSKPTPIHRRNFHKACRLAHMAGVTTVLITGKGEPTLFPSQISEYLDLLAEYQFPFIELQTNGIRLAESGESDDWLGQWYDQGLTTIMLSVAGIDPALNRQIYVPHRERYLDLAALVGRLKGRGYVVRLCVVGIKCGVDRVEKIEELLAFARQHKIDQVTWRPAKATDSGTLDAAINRWVAEHSLTENQWGEISDWAREHGTLLMNLVHGSAVYDLDGQNLCVANCLTLNPREPELRQIIFWPSGRLTYDWQYPAAVLL